MIEVLFEIFLLFSMISKFMNLDPYAPLFGSQSGPNLGDALQPCTEETSSSYSFSPVGNVEHMEKCFVISSSSVCKMCIV